MLLNQSALQTIHRYCVNHRPLVEQSSSAGCFCCGATFSPDEIREWIQESDGVTGQPVGQTARCPRCGIDSVLPSAAPVMLSPQLLHAMQTFWFQGSH
jgi:hypothetical protein